MNHNQHRQALVRVLIRSLRFYKDTLLLGNAASLRGTYPVFDERSEAFGESDAEDNEVAHPQRDYCMATSLFFPDKLSEMQITYSDYGPIWMGLWLDDEVRLDEDGDGNTLFPRWLAEVLNKECPMLTIGEENIYDETEVGNNDAIPNPPTSVPDSSG